MWPRDAITGASRGAKRDRQVGPFGSSVLAGAAEAFGPGRAKSSAEDFDRERKRLQAKVGELTLDLDWLREKSKQLGL